MRLNAFFPSLDIGTDPAKIRDWAQAAEDMGYAYIEVPDHVFGVKARDGWVPLYNERDPFHETFVTLGFLAAVTKSSSYSWSHNRRSKPGFAAAAQDRIAGVPNSRTRKNKTGLDRSIPLIAPPDGFILELHE